MCYLDYDDIIIYFINFEHPLLPHWMNERSFFRSLFGETNEPIQFLTSWHKSSPTIIIRSKLHYRNKLAGHCNRYNEKNSYNNHERIQRVGGSVSNDE